MRLSLNITNYSWPGGTAALGPELAGVVRAADAAGIDTVWVADHLIQADPTAVPDSEMLEAYTALGFLAAQTERVRLGTMVSAVTYRPPSLLIKAVTTLDVVSGGGAWLGLGAGYHEDEARTMGLSFPPMAERFEVLEETLELALRMWEDDRSPFEGRHLRLERPVGNPRPVVRLRPPILVGGAGERKTLRLVARYADACNLFDIPERRAHGPAQARCARAAPRGGRAAVRGGREDRQYAPEPGRDRRGVRRALRGAGGARPRPRRRHHAGPVDRGARRGSGRRRGVPAMMSRHDREGGVHGERRPAGQHVEMPQSEQESARSAERGIVSTSRLA
jgi:F420-dependent oxidoreductase-like protein